MITKLSTPMKKVFISIIAMCVSLMGFSQNETQAETKPEEKSEIKEEYVEKIAPAKSNSGYFISASYGVGNSAWSSNLKNSKLFSKYGDVIKSGDMQYTSKTSVRYQDLHVMLPVRDMYFGLGVNFEEHTMDIIDIKKAQSKPGEIGEGEQVFDQKFRLDKFYALLEMPFYSYQKIDLKAAFQMRIGYFGYYGADRDNFFGDEQMPRAFFGNFGATVSTRLYSRIYGFINPKVEYNYFNNHTDISSVTHNIYTFGISAGIRIDVGNK